MRAGVELKRLAGAAIELPEAGCPTSYPWLQISGWAVGVDGPVETVDVIDRGRAICRVPLDVDRPDLEGEFPEFEWARRAGFAAQVSLIGTAVALGLEVRAAFADGGSATIGTIGGGLAGAPPTPVRVMLDGRGCRSTPPAAVFRQTVPATRIAILNAPGLPGHPGVVAAPSWNQALDDPAALVWLSDGTDSVTDEFIARAVTALAQRRDLSFVAAVQEPDPDPTHEIAEILSGRGLGHAIMFRASALRTIGGIDEAADSVFAAGWDLAVRLAEAGHDWGQIAAGVCGGRQMADRLNENAARWLYRKHAALYERHLREVLLDREAAVGRLLQRRGAARRELVEELMPRLHGARRERDRVSAKLRRHESSPSATPSRSTIWGDLRRLERLSHAGGRGGATTLDWYYIGSFLRRHSDDARGAVLKSSDLCRLPDLPGDSYDCVIITGGLQLVARPAITVSECRRVLKPGGVLLVSVLTVSSVDSPAGDPHYWRFSEEGLRELISGSFAHGDTEIHAEGNRQTVLAFLAGLTAEQLPPAILETADEFPLAVTARAVKPGGGTQP